MNDVIGECLAGRISPQVALARLALAGVPDVEIATLLPDGSELAALFETQRGNLATLARMLKFARVDHDDVHTPQAIARMFDRAVAVSPEASVAAYTLGDPALLARATREVTDWLFGLGAIQGDSSVLDLGCGTGRVAASLSPHVASVLGLDVSPGMVAEARGRHAKLPNVRFAVTDGAPPALPDASLDLLLAVDSFPYLVQAGLADAHAAATAAALRPGGWFIILNLSYGALEDDIRRAEHWARLFGLEILMGGVRPFAMWDGVAFVLRRQNHRSADPAFDDADGRQHPERRRSMRGVRAWERPRRSAPPPCGRGAHARPP